ncbi:MAG: four-carbon acid sugar kinase family protein [Kineosporiaceae bacterium]
MSPTAREQIRTAHQESGRRIAVLDDDPTGSQAVHDVALVFDLDPAEYAAGLAEPGATCFVLTNSRSLSGEDAYRLVHRVGRDLMELGERLGVPMSVVSRSDSTLRGHLIAEVRALDAARREVLGRGVDGVLLVPAYLEAGRFTTGNTHWARVGGHPVPVGQTEFARDAAFGYRSSDLVDFVVERGRGTIDRHEVHALTLDDIRLGGPERVARILADVEGGRFVVVNATSYDDLETVVLGLLAAEADGKAFLHRTGPSFVRALAGLGPRDPLTAHQIWPDGRPPGHGLVVVGSHVDLTTRQVAAARGRGGLVALELDVAAMVDPGLREGYVAAAARQAGAALARSDVLLVTSRTVLTADDPPAGLRLARTVSAAVADVVRGVLDARPQWIVAKGGITSHDVAVTGLGIRRGVVLGQLLPGLISVVRPITALPGAQGVPYIVFAGNVGGEDALADVVDVLGGRSS